MSGLHLRLASWFWRLWTTDWTVTVCGSWCMRAWTNSSAVKTVEIVSLSLLCLFVEID